MRELINISDAECDIEGLLEGNPDNLIPLLKKYELDGIELMGCYPDNTSTYPADIVYGLHLWFFPHFMDFWTGVHDAYFPYKTKEAWLAAWYDNFRMAGAVGAEYVVFHVAQVRPSELCSRNFFYAEKDIIAAVLEIVGELLPALPSDCHFLYENLWWRGLTLLDPEVAAQLLEKTPHAKTGFMLDVGHMMNTSWDLRNENDGVRYTLQAVDNLAAFSSELRLADYIKGIHLHKSLSGEYAARMQRLSADEEFDPNPQEIMDYIMKVDQHLPFDSGAPQALIDRLTPDYLVHEFIATDRTSWEQKIAAQHRAIKR